MRLQSVSHIPLTFLAPKGCTRKISLLLFALGLTLAQAPAEKSLAAIDIPRNLDSTDRKLLLHNLGLGSSSKVLSNPYPLGGYSGFEIGLTVESISIRDLSALGDQADNPSTFSFPVISIGKGLYNNIDVFVHFSPLTESFGFSEFGALLRWVFFQAKFFPTTFALLAHGNSANFSNKVSTETSGVDLVAGITIRRVAMYLGAGQTTSIGNFVGGASGVTDTDLSGERPDRKEQVASFHSVIGMSIQFDRLFLAFQIDRYLQPAYGLKLGLRY